MAGEHGVVVDAGFRPGIVGTIFCVTLRPPEKAPCGAVLFVPGFAEEMNKSRHVVAQTGRALAARGVVVEIPDLYGCGDSHGSLADASPEAWLQDLEEHARSLAQRVEGPVHLWGMRAGALLAAALCRRLEGTLATGDLVLWQPVLRGRQVLSEFLRLRAAAGLFRKDAARESADRLRERLRQGESIEAAGYTMSPVLADGLDSLALAQSSPGPRRVHWFEVSRDISREASPAVRAVRDAWAAAGAGVRLQQIAGPAFWSAGELEDCPELVTATTRALSTPAA